MSVAVFDLKWSGQSFGNEASATGLIQFDPSLIPNPNNGMLTDIIRLVKDFSITITGANRGNGTFILADFRSILFGTPPHSPLDFTQELVGQSATPPSLPFGTPGAFGDAGDFNLFSFNPHGLSAIDTFQFATANGSGDILTLTSFAPRSSLF